jgi:adenosylhomocysteine nucleosidase
LNATGVVAALTAEARTLGPATRRPDGLRVVGDGALLAVSGIGGAAAALAARRLADAGVTSLVSWGMAGGLDPVLSAGTICLPNAVISARGARFATDPHWRELLRAAIAAPGSVVDGMLLSSASAIDGVAAKAAAFRETGAVAVDMESLAVAEIAATHGLPFVAVRVIVDTAADVLPPAVVDASSSGQVELWRLLRGLVRSPAAIPALLRLARRYRAANRSLVAVARSGALVPAAFATTSGPRVA